jgi:aspartate-semialdehyde dehydrogenase
MINLAIVGATGLVGNEILKVLDDFNFPIKNLYLCASEKSKGKIITFRNKPHEVITVNQLLNLPVDIVIFSAGSEVSKHLAPILSEKGVYVVDNSSQWRLYPHVPLVVPEINAHTIQRNTRIIANPNCSTIQMVLALYPLHRHFTIKRIVVSTYQSVTGTGMKAVNQLLSERKGENAEMIYPFPIDLNCFPHGGSFTENGYTTEELKLINETRKILNDEQIKITSTVVRIPVIVGHSESVNVELGKPFEIQQIYELLANPPGIVVMDKPHENYYPTPRFAQGKNEVFVGRIRRDDSVANGLNIWIVADNLRKGAATNAVQIAQYIVRQFF